MSYFVTAEDDSSITEVQMGQFLNDLTELVEKHNWVFGGGMSLKNVNSED